MATSHTSLSVVDLGGPRAAQAGPATRGGNQCGAVFKTSTWWRMMLAARSSIRKKVATAKVGNTALEKTEDVYTNLTDQIKFSRNKLNNKTYLALWGLFGVATIVIDYVATYFYYLYLSPQFIWSGIFIATGLTKLVVKWCVIREKKIILSCRDRLYNVVEYRIGMFRYYDVYIGRVIVNMPFDWMTVIVMTASVGFIFNKTEAVRLTFDKLWWLYLSYFTFEDPPVSVSALYVAIFTAVNITFQTRIVTHYYGFPCVEEYALVRSESFRQSALATLNASAFCVGFDAENRYVVKPAAQFQLLSEPRFFRIDELQGPVPTFDIWKMLQALECPRQFHRQEGVADLFKYSLYPRPKSLWLPRSRLEKTLGALTSRRIVVTNE